MTYLADFKAHIDEMPDFKNKNAIQANFSLLRFYELPKKRNNLLSAFLVYFYLQNSTKLKGKTIFKVIHLYMLIIVYRNRLPVEMRSHMLELDTKRFYSIGERISSWWHGFKRKHIIFFSHQTKTFATLSLFWLIGFLTWKFVPVETFLKADVAANGKVDIFAMGKIAMDSMLLGRITDGALASVTQFWIQNILIIALLALIVQSLRTGLTNVFVNNLLTKFFDFIGLTCKMIFRVVFYVYNYAIYKLSTRFMLTSIDFVIARGIRPGKILLLGFMCTYAMIYIGIISLYLTIASYFITWNIAWWHIVGVAVIFSSLLIYINLHKDILNFREFFLEIENNLKEAIEAREKKKSEVKPV